MYISETQIDVRYAETDQMGVVHHSNYIIWFELGRTVLIKEIGFNYAELEKDGILSPVTDVHVSYKHPTTYGETVKIKTWVQSYDGLRVIYHYQIENAEGTVCVTGDSTHVCVRKETFRPISMRKHLPKWDSVYKKIKHDAYESEMRAPESGFK